MIFEQKYLNCLAHASYLIGDESSGRAVVVDPQRDIDEYLQSAAAHGLRIEHVFLTHFHADFIAGHLELRDRTGARIHLGARGEAEYDFEPANEGDVLDLGRVRLQILETPGHTPEGICLLVFDLDRDAKTPHAVLTGDTLFIGDVGRPDLMASVGASATDLGGQLYDSLHDKLLPLPDSTLVYPAHGAGSMCGRNLSKETVSTIGEQRRFNYALRPMSRDDFVRLVTADQPEAPSYFAYDADMNRRERPTLDATLARTLRPLSLAQALELQKEGATVLDVRDPSDWAGAHWTGSIDIGLGGQFATWAGTLLDRERAIVLVAEPGREVEAATRLGRIGFDRIAGYLEGGMAALAARPDLVRSIERVTAPVLADWMAAAAPPVLIDVRRPAEHAALRIEGALQIPLSHLERRLDEIPRGRRVVVHCASGYRSAVAVSILERHDVRDATDLVGGIAAWQASSLPVGTATAG